MAPTNAAATGAWSIQNRNNARQGRALLQGLYLGVNTNGGDPIPLAAVRSGVVPTVDSGAIIYDLRVIVTSGLAMSVKPGTAIINRTGQGPYEGWLTGSSVPIASDTAPATNPRNDIVVMRIYDAAQGDTVPATGPCQIEVITGTPGAVPVDPAITGLAGGGVTLALARAQVSTGGVITLTDLRKGTSLLGGVRPLLPGDALADQSNLSGDLRWTGSTLDMWRGSDGSWQPVALSGAGSGFAKYTDTGTQGITGGVETRIKLRGATVSCPDVTPNAALDRFTLNRSGVWSLTAALRAPNSSIGDKITWISDANTFATGRNNSQTIATASVYQASTVSKEDRFSAGDSVSMWHYTNQSFTLGVVDQMPCMTLTWVRA
ncbi:hypothetical protein [Amycolatopsis sp. H20-H5]|uniref:hypothetical protein n=1 Tax=Amycolatopsis sp. H20-H5 TaxID=3046309 RepID=UPI002DBD0101|nr:hypothetical protein [Amycolatopsis sp. H20-H5]MEC3974732.1 hypothetical protein [Amycolatopsis sp. H20-H5]